MSDIMNAGSALSTAYCGAVKLEARAAGKTVYRKTLHNSGELSLFKFMALCSAGDFAAAASLRPGRIRFFYIQGDAGSSERKLTAEAITASGAAASGSDDSGSAVAIDAVETVSELSAETAVSPFITIDQTPTVEFMKDYMQTADKSSPYSRSTYKTKLHFTVSASAAQANGGLIFNRIALYPLSSAEISQPLAQVIVTDQDGAVSEVSASEIGRSFTLSVTWELSFSDGDELRALASNSR